MERARNGTGGVACYGKRVMVRLLRDAVTAERNVWCCVLWEGREVRSPECPARDRDRRNGTCGRVVGCWVKKWKGCGSPVQPGSDYFDRPAILFLMASSCSSSRLASPSR